MFLVLAGLAGLPVAERGVGAADRGRRSGVAANRPGRMADPARRPEAETSSARRRRWRAPKAEAVPAWRRWAGRVAFQARGDRGDRDRALLLALEAARRSDAPGRARVCCSGADARSRDWCASPGTMGPAVAWLDVRGDPARVAWIDVEGTLRVADLADPDARLLEATLPGGRRARAWHSRRTARRSPRPAGQAVATWDVATGAQRWPTARRVSLVGRRLAFVDGRSPLLAVAGSDGSVAPAGRGHGRGPASDGRAGRACRRRRGPGRVRARLRSGRITRIVRSEQDGSIAAWDVRRASSSSEPIRRPPQPEPDRRTVPMRWSTWRGRRLPTRSAILFSDGFGLLNLLPEPAIVGPQCGDVCCVCSFGSVSC